MVPSGLMMSNSRITTAALAGFAFVRTSVMRFVIVRRNKFRPWLPTYAIVATTPPGNCC